MSANDNTAMEIFQKTTTKYKNRYAVGLLWKEDYVVLPNIKPLAVSRLYNLEKKFGKNQNKKQMYTETMNNYVAKGYTRQLSKSEVKSTSRKINYLQHHWVTNINKSNRLRVVFDAAVTYSGTSLNQNLLKRPDLLSSLIGVLMKLGRVSWQSWGMLKPCSTK